MAGVTGHCGQREAAATTAAELESLYEMGRVWVTQASEIEKKKFLIPLGKELLLVQAGFLEYSCY